jgi:hypothetical protein
MDRCIVCGSILVVSRLLCQRHYTATRSRVLRGETTWEREEREGRSGRARKGRDRRFIRY